MSREEFFFQHLGYVEERIGKWWYRFKTTLPVLGWDRDDLFQHARVVWWKLTGKEKLGKMQEVELKKYVDSSLFKSILKVIEREKPKASRIVYTTDHPHPKRVSDFSMIDFLDGTPKGLVDWLRHGGEIPNVILAWAKRRLLHQGRKNRYLI